MCGVIRTSDDKELGTAAEMAAYGLPITDDDIANDWTVADDGDVCLCCVEVRDVLDRAGIAYEVDQVWGDFCLRDADGNGPLTTDQYFA